MASSTASSPRRNGASSPAIDVALVATGTALVALSFNLLLRPNQLAPGGLPGISLLVEQRCGIAPALTQAVLNFVIVSASWRLLGRTFALRGLLGSLLLPLFVWLSHDWTALTHDRLLAVICGGAGTGAGIGLVFRGRGSVGGFSAVAFMLHRRFGFPIDRALIALDAGVVLCAAFTFPPEAVLAALVGVFLIGRSARAVLTGFNNAQFALIISTLPERIRPAILRDLNLGLTILPGRGGHTGEQREVLMAVMRPTDVPRLKATVRALDPAAFVVLTEASEVLGYGFKPHL